MNNKQYSYCPFFSFYIQKKHILQFFSDKIG